MSNPWHPIYVCRAMFKRSGISENVTVTCTNFCVHGFGLNSDADAMFLDMPSPWVQVLSMPLFFHFVVFVTSQIVTLSKFVPVSSMELN